METKVYVLGKQDVYHGSLKDIPKALNPLMRQMDEYGLIPKGHVIHKFIMARCHKCNNNIMFIFKVISKDNPPYTLPFVIVARESNVTVHGPGYMMFRLTHKSNVGMNQLIKYFLKAEFEEKLNREALKQLEYYDRVVEDLNNGSNILGRFVHSLKHEFRCLPYLQRINRSHKKRYGYKPNADALTDEVRILIDKYKVLDIELAYKLP